MNNEEMALRDTFAQNWNMDYARFSEVMVYNGTPAKDIARTYCDMAYQYADAMLKARKMTAQTRDSQ